MAQELRQPNAGRLGRRLGPPAREQALPPWPPPPGPLYFEELRRLMLNPSQGEKGPRALAPLKQKRLFERDFAALCGRRFCVAVNSGTTALDLAIEALGLPPAGVVVAADYGHPSTIRYAALSHRLRLIDVDPASLCLSAAALEQALDDGQVRAVLVTQFGGHCGELESIERLCETAGVPLVVDASHSHGATFSGRPAGSFGRVACFSLHATKSLSAGEGGVLCFNDETLFDRVWRLHDIGRRVDAAPYEFETLGGNFRLSEVAALEARHRLSDLGAQVARRHAAATNLISRLGDSTCLVPLRAADGDVAGWHIFAAWYRPELCGDLSRKRFILAMCGEGIPCNQGWPAPLSALPAVQAVAEKTSTPTAVRACREIVWFDSRLLLLDEGADQLLEALEKVTRSGRAREL